MIAREWRLASATGSVYFWIVAHPGARIGDIADGLSITKRAVWQHTGPLQRAGLIDFYRDPVNKKVYRYFDVAGFPKVAAEAALKDRR